jgi:hypothetical protein
MSVTSTNIQTFFGFKVEIERKLKPSNDRHLTRLANKVATDNRLDLRQFHVYCHQVQVIMTESCQFGFEGDIAARINTLQLAFKVNKDQREFDDIVFHFTQNPAHHDVGLSEKLEPTMKHSVTFDIPSAYFQSYKLIRLPIFTFVRHGRIGKHRLKIEDRKIKLVVLAFPTSAFAQHITSPSKIKRSDFNIFLDRASQLKFDFDGDANVPVQTPSNLNQEKRASGSSLAPSPSSQTIIHVHAPIHGNIITSPSGAVEANYVNSQVHKDLEKLYAAIKNDSKCPPGDVAAVANAVKSKDRAGALSALSNASHWLARKANELSVPAALAVIKEVLKIGLE